MARIIYPDDLGLVRLASFTTVWVNGCFDLLHQGHVHLLHRAREIAHGSTLVVGVNSDESIRALKGPGRPIQSECERSHLVAALAGVDYVAVFGGANARTCLDRLRPAVVVKGSDHRPRPGTVCEEAVLVESWGGRVEYVDRLPGLSTTSIIQRIAASNGGMRDGAD
jgi:rfaE bifunctional protein nucleotidyltransferase chain/domain